MSPLPGWQVTLCDPIWYVSSCGNEALQTSLYFSGKPALLMFFLCFFIALKRTQITDPNRWKSPAHSYHFFLIYYPTPFGSGVAPFMLLLQYEGLWCRYSDLLLVRQSINSTYHACIQSAYMCILLILQPFYDPLSGLLRLVGTIRLNHFGFAEADMMGWQWHQLNHMQAICTSLQKITTMVGLDIQWHI